MNKTSKEGMMRQSAPIAWIDMLWPKQDNSLVHLEKTPVAHPSRRSLSSLPNFLGSDPALRFIDRLFHNLAN